jgi:hypothetical protein
MKLVTLQVMLKAPEAANQTYRRYYNKAMTRARLDGTKDIQYTVRYTAPALDRFKEFLKGLTSEVPIASRMRKVPVVSCHARYCRKSSISKKHFLPSAGSTPQGHRAEAIQK